MNSKYIHTYIPGGEERKRELRKAEIARRETFRVEIQLGVVFQVSTDMSSGANNGSHTLYML